MRSLRFFIFLVAALATTALLPAASVAAGPQGANGGGRGYVGGEPFSQFGFGVTKHADGRVEGHFNCLMAGATAFEMGDTGWKLMAVRGQVTSAVIGETTATFSGVGVLIEHLEGTNEHRNNPQAFQVVVTESRPGVPGTLQLTLFPTPGIAFVLPPEQVLDGRITIG
ncbi:MAG: hypothetical protein ABR521_03415 [Gaiellaceae bacterium]